MPSVQNLDQLLTLFTGSGKTTQSSTVTPNISKAGVDALIQQILESSQGLANVASGQKGAGLYNSSTNQMLTNDLISRAGAETAKATSGTTTTGTSKTAGKMDPMTMLGLMGGNKLIKGKVLDPVLSALGLGGDTAGLGAASEALSAGSFGANAGAVSEGLAGSLGTSIGGAAGMGMGLGEGLSFADGLGSLGAAFGADALGSFGVASALGGELSLGAAGLEGLGLASGLELGSAALGASEGIGALSAASAAAEGGGAFEAIATAIAAWVICTELNSRGLLAKSLYQASAQRALTLSPEIMAGYHYWAIPFVRQMRKSTIWGKFLTKLSTKIAIRRCEYLLGKPSFLGKLTITLGEPICAFIGKRVSKVESYTTLYEVQ